MKYFLILGLTFFLAAYTGAALAFDARAATFRDVYGQIVYIDLTRCIRLAYTIDGPGPMLCPMTNMSDKESHDIALDVLIRLKNQ